MKILVAGAGHGGLAAAGLLAQRGARVTVFERSAEEAMGYDWTDVFNLACLREAGIPLPGPSEYRPANDMTFICPSRKTLTAYASQSEEAVMERRALLRHLIAFARGCGVEFLFETSVEKPLLEGNRVVGLAVKDKSGMREHTADLVIDAAGMNSPVRTQLPESLGIVRQFRRDQYFTVLRAFFSHTGKAPLGGPWSVYFFPLGRQCVTWIGEEEGYTDLLCGSFGDTDRAYAEAVRQSVLERHPTMGDEILRGGQVVKIPVRRPLGRMVADGYAAVGDAAAMTVPLVGSGICNAIRAGRLLAETALAPGNKNCTAAQLWPYQVEYMRQIGAVHASLDVLKSFVLSLRPEQINCIFERRLLESPEMTNARVGREVSLTLPQMAVRGLRGAGHLPLLLRMAGTLSASRRLKRHALRIPARYDEEAVKAWARVYEGIGW